VKEHSKAEAEIEEWHSKSHFLSTISYIAFIHTEYRLNLFIEVDSEKSKNTDIKEVPHLWVKRGCFYFKSSWGAIQKKAHIAINILMCRPGEIKLGHEQPFNVIIVHAIIVHIHCSNQTIILSTCVE